MLGKRSVYLDFNIKVLYNLDNTNVPMIEPTFFNHFCIVIILKKYYFTYIKKMY